MSYINLRNKLAEKRIETKLVALCLGVDEKTIRNKLDGKNKVGFSWEEANKIHKMFLSEYDPQYLFERSEVEQSTA